MNKDEVKKQLEHNFKTALKCLNIDSSTIGIIYEDNPTRFNSEINSAECDGKNLYINEKWIDFLMDKNDFYDIKYIMYHEARHIYQKRVIEEFKAKGKSSELPAKITKWENNFNNYERNVGMESLDANANQVVEIDANAFAIVLLLFQGITEYRLNEITESATLALVDELLLKYKYKFDEWKTNLEVAP